MSERTSENRDQLAAHAGQQVNPRRLPYPNAYPNGWYGVCLSSDLPPGRVVRRRLAGEDIVVYRTRSGLLRVVRPYCPHLGAHLGYGGAVDHENLVCPFHHFAYDSTGACVRTGYGTPPPPNLKLTLVESCEADGIILVWYDVKGNPSNWKVHDTVPSHLQPRTCRTYTLRDHPQEVFENIADRGHFGPIHKTILNSFSFEAPDTETWFKASWDARPAARTNLGIWSATNFRVEVEGQGLGFASARVVIPKLGTHLRAWAVQVPIDPTHLELRIGLRVERIFGQIAPRLLSRLIDRAFLVLQCKDVARDFPVWRNKIHQPRPRLVKGDGPIMEYRRWVRKFYYGELETPHAVTDNGDRARTPVKNPSDMT
ncbi:Rieske 2Fe-2S domain-containing protein [Amycolatopsis speibonae]|uniref:Rieske-type oxygenase n=1 Tax=Amycolatopsis speibonae TaxID=1450224 RepID=A0ABV7P3W0_9PSEU